MPRYARRDASDYAVDVVDAADAAAAAARFGNVFPANAFHVVPSDTKHAAKLTFTGSTVTGIQNPPDPVAATVYRKLTPNQVVDLILAQIGTAGLAACLDDATAAMKAWRFKLQIARDISRDQAAQGLSIIVNAGHMTAGQRTAILDAWPTA